MSELEERTLVASLARKWVGLPYYNSQRVRGLGGDCTFFVLVYEDAGLIPQTDIPPYSPQAALNSAAAIYETIIKRYARETETPQMGDVVLYKFGRTFSHGSVVVDPGWPHIVHGDRMARFIVEAEGDRGALGAAPMKFYTLW